MESEEEHNFVPGCCPEFGAIFMSNSATKEECFRRNLLGLPSGQGHFVKQVKAGMILFLFEFERRELHGVYQASSNGAMNIVPHAFSSTGKQFPAQVKFTPLWHCSPLSEVEFHNAIKENYYAARKFNFGLSEDQVRKLLCLFSSRKLKPQRHFTRQEVARNSRRAADDERSNTSNPVDDEHDTNCSHRSVISTGYFGARLCNGGSSVCDGRLEAGARVGNEHKVDNAFGTAISTVYSGLLQPRAISTAYTGNANILQGDSAVQQFKTSSAFCRSIEPQDLNISRSTFSGDAIVLSSLPCDLDVPAVTFRQSSSYEHNFNPVQKFASPHNSSAESSYLEPRSISRHTDFNSDFGYYIPMPLPNYHGNFQSTRMPVLGAAFSDNIVTNASENDRGFSLARTSSGPVNFPDSGDATSSVPVNFSDRGNASYSFNPSHYRSFVFDYGCREASQEKIEQEMPLCGINRVFATNIDMFKESRSQLQGQMCPVEFNSVNNHDNSSLKPDVCKKNFEGMYSECGKNRGSVFLRLGWPPKASAGSYDSLMSNDEDNIDPSVDEVMSMLHHSHYQWLAKRKSRQLTGGDTTNFRKKRQTASGSNLLKDHSQKISDEMKMIDIPASEENVDQFDKKICFVDFKRRSELRKSHNGDTKTSGSSGSAESEGIIDGLRKRRKLIRPSFSKNELTDEGIVNVDTAPKVEQSLVSSQISHADSTVEAERASDCKGEETAETCRGLFRNVIGDGKEMSGNVDVGTIPSSMSCEDSSYIAEEGITAEDSVMDGLSQDLNNREVKELSQNVGMTISSEDKSCISGKVLALEDLSVSGFSQDLNNSTKSVGKESFLEACERSGNGSTSSETENSRNKELFQNADFNGETPDVPQILQSLV